MNVLQALGNFGEFVGAIGVVVSLIYLAQQLSHNSNAVRASSFNSMIQNSLRLLEHQFIDKELAAFLARAEKDPDSLDEAERFRWDSYMMAVYRHFGNLVYQNRVGALDHKMWESYRADLKENLEMPSWRAWFDQHRHVLSTTLQDEVECIVGELRSDGLIVESFPRSPALADVPGEPAETSRSA